MIVLNIIQQDGEGAWTQYDNRKGDFDPFRIKPSEGGAGTLVWGSNKPSLSKNWWIKTPATKDSPDAVTPSPM